jgi:plastocyanin
MKKVAVALLFVVAALALVACGGSDSSSSESAPAETTSGSGSEAGGGGGEAEGGTEGSAATVDFEAASSGLAFTTKTAEAEAGEVTINFTNPQAVPHDVAIEPASGGAVIAQTEQLTEGSDSATANLKPGTYTFFCTVPGHREAGMEGTLTVK